MKDLIIALLAVGFAAGSSYAADSYTYTVSLVIPEIPGVNAPLRAQNADSTYAQAQEIRQAAEQPAAEQKQETATIQTEEVLLAKDDGTSRKLYTFYGR